MHNYWLIPCRQAQLLNWCLALWSPYNEISLKAMALITSVALWLELSTPIGLAKPMQCTHTHVARDSESAGELIKLRAS